jgi:hypothetical protein
LEVGAFTPRYYAHIHEKIMPKIMFFENFLKILFRRLKSYDIQCSMFDIRFLWLSTASIVWPVATGPNEEGRHSAK